MVFPTSIVSSLFILFCAIISTTTNALEETLKQTEVRREHNLDHWDSDTLAYYLDNYPGYDLAIMFYAPWDDNSRRLAPYWNRMAEILDAGSSQSKLIMVSTVPCNEILVAVIGRFL